ncbi:ATP-dependent Clp protease proteolytic subunit [Thermoflexus sp.]|jgi:ATP-dependent Clp protease protease subunit|uniref:ATP-dependent Clp protease proteolytic subunit n=1 Tax=Thermoflexus sp. TaxID=1969742 RepID=UPI002637683E|nr:ATP-dependent Clp protease proteolytic subunit [Thermoflexus sp.]
MDRILEESLKHRILFLGTPINESTVNTLILAMLLMNAADPSAPIELYINSAGGNILDGLALYDAMQAIRAPIATYCVGCALSMAACILAAGSPGMRFATPNARVMIHEPSTPLSEAGGSLTSVRQTHGLMRDLFRTLARILARHTGQPLARIQADMRRTRWFTAEEALRYGFIDAIVPVRKNLPGLPSASHPPAG